MTILLTAIHTAQYTGLSDYTGQNQIALMEFKPQPLPGNTKNVLISQF